MLLIIQNNLKNKFMALYIFETKNEFIVRAYNEKQLKINF